MGRADEGGHEGVDGGVDGGVERWAAEARADDAVAARARERWLRQQAGEDATVAGVLVDLAEAGIRVVVTTTAGRRHAGVVEAVSRHVLVLADAAGGRVLLALPAVATVRSTSAGGHGAGAGVGVGAGRDVTSDATLADALAGLAAERHRVVLVPVGGEALRGELVSVGRDVCALRLDGRGAVVHVRLDAVAEVISG